MGKAFLYGIGGGGGGGALEEKTVALDMSAGDQEVTPSSGYDGLSKAVVTRPATLVAENIKNGVSIGGITGSYVGSAIPNELDGLVDGSITTFTMPQGKNTVHRYLFYNNSSLTSANLQGATSIEPYAFYSCSQAEITLPNTLTFVGDYAFYGAGKNTNMMELNCPVSRCTVGQQAFRNSKISKVTGKFNNIGSYAFQGDSFLIREIDVDCNSIGTYCEEI